MGDFKFETEEQKKVHPYVDMTNISPPSEKNVPLRNSKKNPGQLLLCGKGTSEDSKMV